jgi:amino acid transporter
MSLSTEIERTKRGPNLEKRCWFSPNWNTVLVLLLLLVIIIIIIIIIIITIITIIVVVVVVVVVIYIIYIINLLVVRPRSCRVIYYFDTPTLGRRH